MKSTSFHIRLSFAVFTLLVGILSAAPALAIGTPFLIKDLTTKAAPANAGPLFDAGGGILYFSATNGTSGNELFKYAGTTVTLVKDINPGVSSSNPGNFVSMGGFVYFTADDGSMGRELWKTDGTESGTNFVADINTTGNASSNPSLLTVMGTNLYFVADDGTNGAELWKTDGTVVSLVKDINTNAGTGSNIKYLKAIGTKLFFWANDGTNGERLWCYDGTSTIIVTPASFLPASPIYDLNGKALFAATDWYAATGVEPWVSDGTPGGTARFDVTAGTNSGFHGEEFGVLGSFGYFMGGTMDAGSQNLFRTDGTSVVNFNAVRLPRKFVTAGTNLFFVGNNGQYGVWKTDGSAVTLVAKPNTDAYWNSSYPPTNLINVNGTLYFTSPDSTLSPYTNYLWKSNGTTTTRLATKGMIPQNLAEIGGVLYFTIGGDLWQSDGTDAGTVNIPITTSGTAGTTASVALNINGTTYFVADDGVSGAELWKSDGTDAGTILVKDINPGINGSQPANLTEYNGKLLFTANDPTNGNALWISDGTETGTTPLMTALDQVPQSFAVVNGLLYFNASKDYLTGDELWSSDGTVAGTVMVKDINSSYAGSSGPRNLTNVNGTLFFAADDGTHGAELWKSDGTAVGTVMVKDINPYYGSSPTYLTNVGGMLFFAADDGTNGIELWKSDGTDAGTVMVTDLNTSATGASSNPVWLTAIGGKLYFAADDGTYGYQLFVSDGTAGGTSSPKTINPTLSKNAFDQYISPMFTELSGVAYFAADDGSSGVELWKSDGTAAGTVQVKDIYPGAPGSSIASMTISNGALYFSANDGVSGAELWQSNGTAAGTVVAADILAGSSGSNPSFLVSSGPYLHFFADDGTHGNEPMGLLLVTPPPTYTGSLTATPGNGQNFLAWTPAGGFDYFMLASGTAPPASCSGGARIYAGSTYVDPGLANGTPYFYRLCAVDGLGNVTGGMTASATPNATALYTLDLVKIGPGSGTVTSSTGGISCGGACTESILNSTLVTLTALPDSGMSFVGWSGGCNDTALTCSLTVDSPKKVAAHFAVSAAPPITWPAISMTGYGYFNTTHVGSSAYPELFTLTNSGSNILTISSLVVGGANRDDFTLSGNTCGTTVAAGASCTMNITFTPQGSGSRTGILTVLSDASNTPVLNVGLSGNGGYTLTIDNPDGAIGRIEGGICGDGCEIRCGLGNSSCSALYTNGTVLNFFQTPSPGTIFSGWSGSGITCPGSGNCSVTIAGDMTLSAGFCNSGTFSVAPPFSTAPFLGSTGSFSVTPATGSCSGWTAGSSKPWLSLSSGANSSGSGAVGYSVAAGPELRGTITAAGQTFDLLRTGGGGLDSSFNFQSASGFGYATLAAALGSSDSFSVNASALQPDGKIVVTGYETPFASYIQNLFVARFNQDGTKDSTFGTAGSGLYLYTGTGNSVGTGIAVQADGRIIVTGYRQNTSSLYSNYYYGEELMVVRLDSSGALDPAFNSVGIAAYGQGTTFSDLYINRANAVAIDSNGNIVAAGYTSHTSTTAMVQDALLVRFTSAGALDTGFNTTGVATYSTGTSSTYNALAILPSGDSIIAAGSTIGSGYNNVLMTKTDSNGVLMPIGFGTGGVVTYQNSVTSDDKAAAVKIQSDGKIVVAGSTAANSYDSDVLLLRYTGSGVLDTAGFNSIGAVPGVVVYGETGSYKYEVANAVVLQSNGKIVVAGAKAYANGDDVMVLRYNVDGTPDSAFGGNSLVTFDGQKQSSDQAASVMIDSNGNIVVAGSTYNKLDGLLLRLTAKSTPVITWANPADITYGTALGVAQLNATSGGVAGTFTYTPANGTVLNAGTGQTLSATFIPSDTISYNIPAAATVAINVNAAGQTISFGTPPGLIYGGAAGSASATGGASGLPVTFSSLTTGVCTISGSAVTPVTAGTCIIAADQSGNGNYTAASRVTQNITVAKAAPVITWANPAAISYGTPLSATQLNATSGGVAGTFVYTPVSGSVLNAGISQTLSVSFTPTDGANYNTPSSAIVTINVTATGQSIGFGAAPSLTYGGVAGTVAATATSGLPVIFSSLTSGVCTVSGSAVTPVIAGTCTIAAGQSGNGNYTAASQVTQNITVAKAVPVITWANPAAIIYGTPLSATQLNASSGVAGTFSYSPANGAILAAGTQTLSVTFTPTDAANFTTQTATVSLTVNALPANQVTTGADGKTTVSVTVTASGASLTLGAGTLLTDAAGNPISGTLTVTASVVNSIAALPAMLVTSLSTDGKVLSALGNSIDITISAGASIVKTINPAMTVNLTIPSTFALSGALVSYYSFDGTTWHLEGTATVKPDGSVDMLVGHLSFWAVATFSSPGDAVPPDITDFTVPATSSSLSVSGITVIATDAVGVTGYLLSESAIPPLVSDSAWTAAAPTTYTCTTWGNRTLYAYAKDAADNISATKSATVLIGPADGVVIPAPATDPPKLEPQLADALKSLNFAMKVDIPTVAEILHGDVAPLVNGVPQPDGVINLGDTIVILRRVVGLGQPLPQVVP
jgi:uncharacterized delta-60 repeat protein